MRHFGRFDLALGAGLTAFDIVTLLGRSPAVQPWGLALWGLQTVPLVWWRRSSGAVLFAMTVAYALVQALGPVPGKVPGPFLLMVGVYAVACYTPPRFSLPGTAACGLAAMAADLLTGNWQPPRPGSLDPISATTFVVFFSLAWVLGYGRRRISADADSLRDLNARLRASQEHNARQAVVTERARIARDLHDVVAHHVSAIAVQARAAEDVLRDEPLLAKEGVGRIAATADTALLEMRRILGLLGPGDEAPAPSLAHLDGLVAAAEAAGCQVAAAVSVGTVPVAVQVSAYRIVQESLTNVIKHAGPVSVRVTVSGDDTALTLEVVNSPGFSQAPGSGRGLIGIRERVAAFGGTLDAGPCPSGGWRVRAVLPLAEAR